MVSDKMIYKALEFIKLYTQILLEIFFSYYLPMV